MTLDMGATYSVGGNPGVAFRLKGYAQMYEPFECVDIDDESQCDTGEGEWVDDESMVRAVMIGDDREYLVSVNDLTPLSEGAWCGECGQIGCEHDGRE